MIQLQDADEKWPRQLLDWALPKAETQILETKRVAGKMVSRAMEAICAFANTRSGWLLLGVEDAKRASGRDRLFGIGENPEAVDELLRKLETHFQPVIKGTQGFRLHTKLRDGTAGVVVALYVPASDKVHNHPW